ncbi:MULTISPECIES: tripartite tricarboxylate transporter substrate binding protein [unclassified Achromobacter]|uniref:Bug family tripartite tricarboxylate transporter substrate binding protein n=1 Tax=unclassified Achromobacter TaxID=2626865 RepID=UPI000B51B514|nr:MULTISPECIES: tripartite tricarboxylate transporter substrate binding protein [unclassified Achromobacter]OWT80259.1 LacI family transcriptional regulator [Achromobacter sp. HZ34]OWT82142.1 LacI family transcriptional regulator [Achromobacter sp. HZ28]
MLLKHLRKWLCVAATVFACAATPAHAAYPDRPIRLVIPFAPGGSTDVLGRILAEALHPLLGQTVIVENRPGAGGNIGGDFVARSAPDGYTLLLAAAGPTVINPSLYSHMPFNPAKDLAPISCLEREHNLMVVNKSLPVHNLQDFLEYAKQHPGKLSFGSPGNGSPAQLAGELLKQKAGIQAQHVPYKGTGPAVTDLVAGHIDFIIDNMPALLPQVKAGNLRALAVPSDQRATAAPDIPTFDEAGEKGFVVMAWKGLMAPAGTDPAVIERLHAAVVKALQDPQLRQRFQDLGAEPLGSSPTEFARQIADETVWWGKLVKSTGTKIE